MSFVHHIHENLRLTNSIYLTYRSGQDAWSQELGQPAYHTGERAARGLSSLCSKPLGYGGDGVREENKPVFYGVVSYM